VGANGGAGGRPRKPRHLHVVGGTFRPDRHGADETTPKPSQEMPEPPPFMSERGSEIFQGVATILAGMGMASRDHALMLYLLALRVEEVEHHQVVVEDLGWTYETVNTAGAVSMKARPEAKMRSDAMRHLQSLLHEFGLSPASISKVSAAPTQQANEFADFG
jgi:P27 family predicted phage terminase small subunit